jgi:hypothetical protein
MPVDDGSHCEGEQNAVPKNFHLASNLVLGTGPVEHRIDFQNAVTDKEQKSTQSEESIGLASSLTGIRRIHDSSLVRVRYKECAGTLHNTPVGWMPNSRVRYQIPKWEPLVPAFVENLALSV